MGKRTYTKELKMEIIDFVTKQNHTPDEAAKKYMADESIIRKWVSRYRQHGMEGVERKYRSYSAEFKENVIKDMRENQLSLRETADKYNIGMHTSIKQWERIYLTEGIEGLRIERRGRANEKTGSVKGRKPVFNKDAEEDLLAEVQRLRMENEYLKKLNALVRSREK